MAWPQTDPGGIDQIGCIYTAQCIEFDYAGVIFGPGLRYDLDLGRWVGHPKSSYDSIVKRNKEEFVDLVKNTYRVLLSRGLRGCYVYFVEKETEGFVQQPATRGPTRLSGVQRPGWGPSRRPRWLATLHGSPQEARDRREFGGNIRFVVN